MIRPAVTAATLGDEVAGYGFCAPWRSRPAYRHTVEDSIYLVPSAASLALHRNRGFFDAGRLTAVGFKHGQWLDTLLRQRSLAEVTD